MNVTMIVWQVLGTFQHAVLRSPEETDLDAVLVFQLVSFLVDHHTDVLAVPTYMKEAVEERLRSLEKPQVHTIDYHSIRSFNKGRLGSQEKKKF